MSPGVATAEPAAAAKFESVGEMREVLTLLLDELDRDSELGQRLRAAQLSYRYVFPDLGLALNVISSDEASHNVRWSFSEQAEWEPRLTMEMSSEVANAYLQGRENLAIAMARGRIRCSGDARVAIRLLPLNREISGCYRELLGRHHEHLLMS